MRLVTLFLIAAFAASTVDAASYQKTDGTIVDPIMNWYSDSPHSYSGANLEPEADLTDADLTNAPLTEANLTSAILTGVRSGGITGNPSALPTNWQLTGGYLIGPGAYLSTATLTGAILTGADLTDANLAGLSHEAEDLESLQTAATIVETTMGVWPADAPDEQEDVTIQFEATVGGDMEDVEAVGNLRAGTAVFLHDGEQWSTEGRTLYNLEPGEALSHFAGELEGLDDEELE